MSFIFFFFFRVLLLLEGKEVDWWVDGCGGAGWGVVAGWVCRVEEEEESRRTEEGEGRGTGGKGREGMILVTMGLPTLTGGQLHAPCTAGGRRRAQPVSDTAKTSTQAVPLVWPVSTADACNFWHSHGHRTSGLKVTSSADLVQWTGPTRPTWR